MARPGRQSGITTSRSTWNPVAPASRAASISRRSIRIMELNTGTTMNSV